MSSLKTRLRSLLNASKIVLRQTGVIVRHFFLASIIFIGIPYIYVASNIGPRLDASIYDYFNFLILCWVVFRLETIIRQTKPIILEVKEEDEVELPLLDRERENIMRLKRKLDRRRKKKNNQE